MNISIKRISKICLPVENKFRLLLLVVKNKKLGKTLEKNICQMKEDKI